MQGLRLIQGYYLASPLFLLAGIWWGWEVRVTFLPDLRQRFAYYVLLGALGLLAHFRPSSAPWVALTESAVSLFLIIAWILVPLYGLPDAVAESGAIQLPYTPRQVLVNGSLAGGFLLLGFYQAQAEILRRVPWMAVGQKGGGPRDP